MAATSIYDVLDELRASALDERDKGDKFEHLIKAYLTTDPEWSRQFSNVWLWSEWPGRATQPDTGIDLVAKARDSDDLTAIQCKFYSQDHAIQKADIDSFLSTSGKKSFSRRIVVSTTTRWSKNAEEALVDQQLPTQRLDVSHLDSSTVDWSRFSLQTPTVLPTHGPKALRDHQRQARDAVIEAFVDRDRGKLIMACGTGKTFTALRITEALIPSGGLALFLVPSIQLLSQALREWVQESTLDIRPFAVCSDVRVARKEQDGGDISTIDLAEPATTRADTLLKRVTNASEKSPSSPIVVFATYQSIQVIADAQTDGLADFDLVVCDEAHRTTGVTLADQPESHFVRVHDNDFIRAQRRLYMTATPRIFGDEIKKKAADNDAVLVSMDDVERYGEELYRLGFGAAVERDLLTDYRVLVLAIDESYIAANFQTQLAQNGEITLGDAAKLIGCWNGLWKNFSREDHVVDDLSHMKRAVAFAKDIKSSKLAASSFPDLVQRAISDDQTGRGYLEIEAEHVDGTMNALERNAQLAWLKSEPPDRTCRVLSNARCLSEGVDVPALDAIMFLTPRGSQVDVVQSVGRVMRKAPSKKLGYIVLPVVVPSGIRPEDALRDNERYKVVWQVLQALRSHDDRFHATINQIELNKGRSEKLVIDSVTPRQEQRALESDRAPEQIRLPFDISEFRDAMFARIVQRVGERKYWESWAKDVADIAQAHIERISAIVGKPSSVVGERFEEFVNGLRGNLNESVSASEAIEMLSQHLVTRPIFDALFQDYDFVAENPVAQTMERMLTSLQGYGLESETDKLKGFYDSVRRRVEGVHEASGKQRVIVELYDKFFATAFKRTVDRLGIVYTPVEIVDFVIRSADELLYNEFGARVSDQDVHVLDGFAGTGTFITRLLQSGLINAEDLARKYSSELHANEILLLAYYIAAVNIETTYRQVSQDQQQVPSASYQPFEGLVLTDTFQSYEDGDRDDLDVFPENNERIVKQRALPITVILGNPPWSVGQDSANDNNANQDYPSIDAAIKRDYSSERGRGGNNSLYDQYIRALKWASLRVSKRGIVSFVTNGGFLWSNVASEMRKSLASEFSAAYVFNLRGNGRVAGEDGAREGRPVFEEGRGGEGGSRASVAIIALVKNPNSTGPFRVYYSQVADGLNARKKLDAVAVAGSFAGLDLRSIVPDEYGDWLSQRTVGYSALLPLGAKHGDDLRGPKLFQTYGRGLETGRDWWVYQSSKSKLEDQVRDTVDAYNSQVEEFRRHVSLLPGRKPKDLVRDFIDYDATRISWTLSLKSRLAAMRQLDYFAEHVTWAEYRPFFRQHAYFDAGLNHIRGQMPKFFPSPEHENFGFYAIGPGATAGFSLLMTKLVPDIQMLGAGQNGQYFPRWYFVPQSSDDAFEIDGTGIKEGSFLKFDNVSDEAQVRFEFAYGHITKDDIFYYAYGLLHSPTYRRRYDADLKKMLPRLPLVNDPWPFVQAGRELAQLHLNYESFSPYPLVERDTGSIVDPWARYEVKKMRYGRPTNDQKVKGIREDRTRVVLNSYVTLEGVPEAAHRFLLGSRSALDWLFDRYQIKKDKASGITSDPNDLAREYGEPRYIVDLVARIIAVSVETMRIVDTLPEL